jgi:hypothetical protein
MEYGERWQQCSEIEHDACKQNMHQDLHIRREVPGCSSRSPSQRMNLCTLSVCMLFHLASFHQHPASMYIIHTSAVSIDSIQQDLAHQTAGATWPFCQQVKPFMLLLVFLFFLPCLSFPGSLAARLADALLFPAVHTTPGNRTPGGSPFQAVWRNLSTRMATARSALADGVAGLAPAVIPYLVWDALPRRPWQAGGQISLFRALLYF